MTCTSFRSINTIILLAPTELSTDGGAFVANRTLFDPTNCAAKNTILVRSRFFHQMSMASGICAVELSLFRQSMQVALVWAVGGAGDKMIAAMRGEMLNRMFE